MKIKIRVLKNILIINPWTDRIGPNTFISGFIKEQLNRGNSVTMIYPFPDSLSQELKEGGCNLLFFSKIKLKHIPNRFLKLLFRFLSEASLLFFLIRVKNIYDYCIINSEVFSFSLIGLPKKTSKYAIVHSLSFANNKKISRAVFFIQYHLGLRLVAVSNAVKDELKKMNVKSEVTQIYNGIDSQYNNNKRYRAFKVPETNVIQVLAVIHPVPHKGAHHLVKALSHVYLTNPKFHCTVVGWDNPSSDLKYMAEIERLVHEYGLSANISFLGCTDDIRPFYCHSHLLLHPSESESFGYVLAEAMSFELPVVAFNVGGISEVIKDSWSGFLVEPYNVEKMADAVSNLMSSEVLRKEYGRNGKQIVRDKFDLKLNMGRLIDMLDNK